ncbi:hypothetical protein RIF29_19857 [Crotalaria pallida]|uniref:Uncharacterized protein n=1 Tax=Crotalaria pallida TaxID=3830 RepID=A0AAN9F0L9_CROPI
MTSTSPPFDTMLSPSARRRRSATVFSACSQFSLPFASSSLPDFQEERGQGTAKNKTQRLSGTREETTAAATTRNFPHPIQSFYCALKFRFTIS